MCASSSSQPLDTVVIQGQKNYLANLGDFILKAPLLPLSVKISQPHLLTSIKETMISLLWFELAFDNR